MEKLCILSDFDGTITENDGLYSFIESYAVGNWQEIEELWEKGKISSKECLIEELKLIPDLSEDLINNFVKSIKIDAYFKSFYEKIIGKNIDFYIVSDGIDYFIERVLHLHGFSDIKVISNHGEFKNGKFKLTFPNDFKACKNNAGTCKCQVAKKLKEKYDKIIYIGDGTSDFCVADKADILFAKSKLSKYCEDNNIKYVKFNNFSDVTV